MFATLISRVNAPIVEKITMSNKHRQLAWKEDPTRWATLRNTLDNYLHTHTQVQHKGELKPDFYHGTRSAPQPKLLFPGSTPVCVCVCVRPLSQLYCTFPFTFFNSTELFAREAPCGHYRHCSGRSTGGAPGPLQGFGSRDPRSVQLIRPLDSLFRRIRFQTIAGVPLFTLPSPCRSRCPNHRLQQ